MAKAKVQSSSNFLKKPTRKRKGIHAKSRNGKIKGGKRYTKKYVGQGR